MAASKWTIEPLYRPVVAGHAAFMWGFALLTLAGYGVASRLGFFDGEWFLIKLLAIICAANLSTALIGRWARLVFGLPSRENYFEYLGMDKPNLKTRTLSCCLVVLPLDQRHPCRYFWPGMVFVILTSSLPFAMMAAAHTFFGPDGSLDTWIFTTVLIASIDSVFSVSFTRSEIAKMDGIAAIDHVRRGHIDGDEI